MEQMAHYYEGFTYSAEKLSAYILVANTFIISLRNGLLTRFSTEDVNGFHGWLSAHGVRPVFIDKYLLAQ